jgi:HAD superfamily phosphoserine phosphatase-like hydrolase
MISRGSGGPNGIAAFFDLDGTLLPSPSLEWRFIAYLLAHDEVPLAQIARWFARCARACLRDWHAATEGNKAYLTGLRESLVLDWVNSLPLDGLPIFSRGLRRIRWHLAQQHQVYFVSGTLQPLACVAARTIAARIGGTAARQFPAGIEVCATQLAARDGHWTGFIAGEHRSGEAKARAIRTLATERNLDLARSFAYGNGIADLPMLSAVGFPFAINPSLRFERAARAHGWPVWDWREVSASPQRVVPQTARAPFLSPKGAR